MVQKEMTYYQLAINISTKGHKYDNTQAFTYRIFSRNRQLRWTPCDRRVGSWKQHQRYCGLLTVGCPSIADSGGYGRCGFRLLFEHYVVLNMIPEWDLLLGRSWRRYRRYYQRWCLDSGTLSFDFLHHIFGWWDGHLGKSFQLYIVVLWMRKKELNGCCCSWIVRIIRSRGSESEFYCRGCCWRSWSSRNFARRQMM